MDSTFSGSQPCKSRYFIAIKKATCSIISGWRLYAVATRMKVDIQVDCKITMNKNRTNRTDKEPKKGKCQNPFLTVFLGH